MTEAMKNGQSTPSVPTTMTMSNLDTITDNMMTTPIENAANNNINNSNGAIIVLPAVFVATILTLILVKKRRITKGKPIDHVFLGSCLRRCAQEKFQLAGHYNASYFNNHSTTPITPSPEANQKWGRHYRKAYMARQKRITLDREYTHVVFGTFSDEVFEKQQVILAIKANVEAAQFDSWQERRKAGLSVTAYNRIKEESEEEASDYKMHYTQKACCISTLAVPNVADLLVEYGEELVCQWVHGDKDLIEDAKFHNNMVALKDDVVGLVKAMTAHGEGPVAFWFAANDDDVDIHTFKQAKLHLQCGLVQRNDYDEVCKLVTDEKIANRRFVKARRKPVVEKKRVLVHQEPIVVETVEEEDDVEVQVEKMASCDDGYGPGAIVVYTPQLETIAEENDQEQVATIQQQAVVIENLPEDMPHSLKCWTGDNACYNSCWDVVSDMTWESLEDESLEDVNEDNVVEDNVVEDCDEFSLTAEEIAFIERYEAKLQQQQHEPVVEDNVVEDNDDTVQSIDDFDLEDDLEYTLTDADWNALRAMGWWDPTTAIVPYVPKLIVPYVHCEWTVSVDKKLFRLDRQMTGVVLGMVPKDILAAMLADGGETVKELMRRQVTPRLEAAPVEVDGDEERVEVLAVEDPVDNDVEDQDEGRVVVEDPVEEPIEPIDAVVEPTLRRSTRRMASIASQKIAEQAKTNQRQRRTTTTTTQATTERRTRRSGRLVKQPNWYIPA